ncbi:unnamed protein product [Caenorhabditis brenneri]
MTLRCLFICILFVSLPVFTSSMTLKTPYHRPVCEQSQSCSYGFQQFTFELCDCPDFRPCSMKDGVQLNGIVYQFCEARDIPTCTLDEIAAELDMLQTSIYCLCPPNKVYTKQKGSTSLAAKYVCQEAPLPLCPSMPDCNAKAKRDQLSSGQKLDEPADLISKLNKIMNSLPHYDSPPIYSHQPNNLFSSRSALKF